LSATHDAVLARGEIGDCRVDRGRGASTVHVSAKAPRAPASPPLRPGGAP
jgi:hypothetical protein